jgi:GNAT superfamily N-acetyltransferase
MTDPVALLDATWPAARRWNAGRATLRSDPGAGRRVNAISFDADAGADDIEAALAAIPAGQTRRVLVPEGNVILDDALARRGFALETPVDLLVGPVAALTDRPLPRVSVFSIWEPLAMIRDIWAASGIGAERQAVMARVRGPRTALLARHRDKPAGAAFVACDGPTAVVHALAILPHQQRDGMGQWVMRAAAFWAADQGADRIAVFCETSNAPAQALFASLGLTRVGGYHYRVEPEEEPTP